jgi:hypothetical protein
VYRSPQTAADWYDEMLVLGDRILITAYNYTERRKRITVIRMARRRADAAGGPVPAQLQRLLQHGQLCDATGRRSARLLRAGGDRFVSPRVRRRRCFLLARLAPRGRRRPLPARAKRWSRPPTSTRRPARSNIRCSTRSPSAHSSRGSIAKPPPYVGASMREPLRLARGRLFVDRCRDGHAWSIDYGNQRRKAARPGRIGLIPAGEPPCFTGCRSTVARSEPSPSTACRPTSSPSTAGTGAFVPCSAAAAPGADRRARLAAGPAGHAEFKLRQPRTACRRRCVPATAARRGEQIENRFIRGLAGLCRRSPTGRASSGDRGAAAPGECLCRAARRGVEAKRLQIPHDAIRLERAGNDAVATAIVITGACR